MLERDPYSSDSIVSMKKYCSLKIFLKSIYSAQSSVAVFAHCLSGSLCYKVLKLPDTEVPFS